MFAREFRKYKTFSVKGAKNAIILIGKDVTSGGQTWQPNSVEKTVCSFDELQLTVALPWTTILSIGVWLPGLAAGYDV